MNNETDISIRFRNYVSGEGKLEKYAKTLEKIKSVTDAIDSSKTKDIENGASKIKDINSETAKMAKNINTAFNYGIVREFTRGLKATFAVLGKLTDKSSTYLENINLFQVAFDGAYEEAERFINKMSEMYGLDESKLTNTVGIFKQLSNAMNLSVETGTKLATLLTQMSIDISSLYNIDVERASSVLQSSLAGQTKPIRGATGADITEATLQTTLNTIGLDKYVGDLTYAEKRLLIIISLTDQLSESTNDFARTIESPANQMRILNEQWERLSRAVGNMFLPILSQVLPYLNAILMVMTEIINVIATFLGYKEDDYDYFAGTADSVLDLEESLGGANKKAKELKQSLRGFDKLNVIRTPKDDNSGIGAGSIDPKIMDAFNKAFDDYNSKLTDVTMKATKIRDSIMEWLGFTKVIDEETGKVSFKFDHITGGTVLGALVVGGTIYKGVKSILNSLKKIGLMSLGKKGVGKYSLSGASGVLGLGHILLAIASIGVITVSIKVIFDSLKESKKAWDETNKSGKSVVETTEKYNKVLKENSEVIDETTESGKRFIDNQLDMIEGHYETIEALEKEKNSWNIAEHFIHGFDGAVEGNRKTMGNYVQMTWQSIDAMWEYYSQGKLNEEQTARFKQQLETFTKTIETVDGRIGGLSKQLGINKEEAEKLRNQYSFVKTELNKMSVEAGNAKNIISKVFKVDKNELSNFTKIFSNLGYDSASAWQKSFISKMNEKINLRTQIQQDLKSGVMEDKYGYIKINAYADGGLPPVGQLFVANEKGPELVGNIGGQSFVANQNQVVDLLDKKIGNSNNGMKNATFVIQVGDEVLAKKVLYDLQDMAKSDGKPIVISP